MKELKIVIAGSIGSGKTTSIGAISAIPVVKTEAKASEADALHRKETTTVAMDYGIAYLDDKKIHLYGTPGQRRFEFMAPVLCKGASGLMVTIDNGGQKPLQELDYYLKLHGEFLKKKPAVIAVTHYDDTRTNTSLIDYHHYCISNGFAIPVIRVDARRKDEVEKMLKRLMSEIEKPMMERTV